MPTHVKRGCHRRFGRKRQLSKRPRNKVAAAEETKKKISDSQIKTAKAAVEEHEKAFANEERD